MPLSVYFQDSVCKAIGAGKTEIQVYKKQFSFPELRLSSGKRILEMQRFPKFSTEKTSTRHCSKPLFLRDGPTGIISIHSWNDVCISHAPKEQ